MMFLTADGRALPFRTRDSTSRPNAVIDYVEPREEQARFVSELVRVARSGFRDPRNRVGAL